MTAHWLDKCTSIKCGGVKLISYKSVMPYISVTQIPVCYALFIQYSMPCFVLQTTPLPLYRICVFLKKSLKISKGVTRSHQLSTMIKRKRTNRTNNLPAKHYSEIQRLINICTSYHLYDNMSQRLRHQNILRQLLSFLHEDPGCFIATNYPTLILLIKLLFHEIEICVFIYTRRNLL